MPTQSKPLSYKQRVNKTMHQSETHNLEANKKLAHEEKKSRQQSAVKPLSLIVELEAKRFFSEAQFEPNPALLAKGWTPRFIADKRQTDEATELYTQLGFEVLTEAVPTKKMNDDCSDCQIVVLLQFKIIYTRKK